MEFMNRGNRPAQQMSSTAPNAGNVPHGESGRNKKGFKAFKGLRIATVLLLFSVTVLIVALVGFVVLGSPKSEGSYVEKDKYQAVFLNGGQVYFGKIRDLNDKYLRMTDIFYLRVNQVVQPNQSNNNQNQQNDISLVKLGCELHRPANEMLINRDQIVFWENLKDENGENTVPGAVKKYLEQFPNGQECSDANQQTNQQNQNTNNSNSNNDTNPSDTTPAGQQNEASNIDAAN